MVYNPEPFDPLDYENLGLSITRALNKERIQNLADVEEQFGVGVYALYYAGPFEPYRRLAEINRAEPGSRALYIGKAHSDAAQTGNTDMSAAKAGKQLYKRMTHHRDTIASAENLDVNDFHVRLLRLHPTWVPVAEGISIRVHKPLWNRIIRGFGSNVTGGGRGNQMRSRWDTLHPGRPYAMNLRARNESFEDIVQDVEHDLAVNLGNDPMAV